MDLSVKEILDQYPNLNEGNIASEEVVATTDLISNELRTRFEEHVIKESGMIIFSVDFDKINNNLLLNYPFYTDITPSNAKSMAILQSGKQSSKVKTKLLPASENWWRIISGPGIVFNNI